MRNLFLFFATGMLVGALSLFGYQHFFGEHQELITAKAKIQELQMASVTAAPIKTNTPEKAPSALSTLSDPKPATDTPKQFALPPVKEGDHSKSDFMKSIVDKQLKQQQQDQLLILTKRLKLSPEQQEIVKKNMESDAEHISKLTNQAMSGEKMNPEEMTAESKNLKTLDQELDAILTPEQKAEYEVVKNDKQKSNIEMRANFEVSQIAPLMRLNEEQKDQFYGMIYQIEEKMQNPDWIKSNAINNSVPSTDPNFYINRRDELKLEAAEKILTPDQFQTYKTHLESAAALQKEMIEKFSPKKTESGTLSIGQ